MMGTVISSFINIDLVLCADGTWVTHPHQTPRSAVAHAKPQGYQRTEKKNC